jgi:serine/threonine-protein kinase RIO1
MSYEDGVAVLNYEAYDMNSNYNMRHAIPFWTKLPTTNNDGGDDGASVSTVDDPLVKPEKSWGYKCPLWQHCRRGSVAGFKAMIRTVKGSQVSSLITNLQFHMSHFVNRYIDTTTWGVESLMYVNRRRSKLVEKEYIVKIQNAETLRRMFTGLKEVHIMDRIYYSSWGAINGCDVVPQPIMGCPVWDGRNWLYVTIMEKVSGEPLSKVNNLSYRLWHGRDYNKKRIIDAVSKVVAAFWALGFSHNDLHWGNVIYDIKTDKVKIIDLESAVMMPSQHVKTLRRHISDVAYNVNDGQERTIERLVYLYTTCYKSSSISLLYLASQYCQQYHDDDNRLYNTDDYALPMAFDLLKK